MNGEDKLDKVLTELTALKTDMDYVKRHIATTADQSVRLAVVENKVNGLTKIAWYIGLACLGAIIAAVLALII